MKRVILLSTVTAMTLFATNGDEMMGLGAKSRALGGTGIAIFNGAENALTNPSLLAKEKSNNEFSFGGTAFKTDVSATTTKGNTANPAIGVSKTSDEGMSVIPSIALAHRISDTMVFGLGMYGTAGMGTDWRGSTVNAAVGKVDLYNMRSSLMLMQFAPSLAYGKDNFGIGVTAIIQYGALSIDYDTADNLGNLKHVGSGISNDFGYGFQLGGYYNPTKSLTLGAVYKSSIDMEYKDQISKAALAFGYGSNPAALAAKTDHLEQPAEIGVGVAFNIEHMTYTGDFKQIKWGSAKGYKNFGWEDQNVIALGAKFTQSTYWLGVGYNHGANPIPNNTDTTSVTGTPNKNTNGDTMNLFNYAMFPATIESAYSAGGGFEVTKGMSIDLAYTYAPEVSDTVSAATVGVGNITTKHSQMATTIALNFKF